MYESISSPLVHIRLPFSRLFRKILRNSGILRISASSSLIFCPELSFLYRLSISVIFSRGIYETSDLRKLSKTVYFGTVLPDTITLVFFHSLHIMFSSSAKISWHSGCISLRPSSKRTYFLSVPPGSALSSRSSSERFFITFSVPSEAQHKSKVPYSY